MKSKVWLALLSTCWLAGCVQYASGYKRGGSGGGAADASAEEGSYEEETGGDEEVSEEGEESAEGPAAETLLSACESCHTSGGSAEKVVLDSTAIPKLDDAKNGKTKADHESVADSFVEPTRADLEAELSAIGLRLKARK